MEVYGCELRDLRKTGRHKAGSLFSELRQEKEDVEVYKC